MGDRGPLGEEELTLLSNSRSVRANSPEFRSWGVVPASHFIGALMKHLGHDYYVGYLSATEVLGSAHQAPAGVPSTLAGLIKGSNHWSSSYRVHVLGASLPPASRYGDPCIVVPNQFEVCVRSNGKHESDDFVSFFDTLKI